MSMALSPSSMSVLASAVTWGLGNPGQLAPFGVTPDTVSTLKSFAGVQAPLNQGAAIDAFKLVFAAEPELVEPREEVTQLMCELAVIASPAAILRSASRFGECSYFLAELSLRLKDAMDVVDKINLIPPSDKNDQAGQALPGTSWQVLPWDISAEVLMWGE